MKTMMIPAFEAAMNEMFSQVAAALDSNLKSLSNEDLHAKVDVLTAMVQSLSVQVSELGTATNKSAGAAPPPPAPPLVNPMQQMRQEILALLKMKSYEPAFTKALSASTAEMAVFCCQNANVSDVLGGNTPALSQPILLCLMQQLGAVLVSSTDADLQTELSWLQEIALTLDPTNENIQRHVPSVLQQLVTSINTKMQQGDPSLRRQLQMLLQVIRGMQR
jgi:enhancer of mRNA-decapping protein 4